VDPRVKGTLYDIFIQKREAAHIEEKRLKGTMGSWAIRVMTGQGMDALPQFSRPKKRQGGKSFREGGYPFHKKKKAGGRLGLQSPEKKRGILTDRKREKGS